MPSYLLKANGTAHTVEAPADMPLLWVLRDKLGMTRTKRGCGEALCGLCTVHVDGEAVRACQLPVGELGTRGVITIEGLSAGIAPPLVPEFFIFEHAHVKTRQELVRDVMSGVGQGTQSAEMKGFRTVVTDSVAWTSMRNHEVWTPVKGAPMPFDFLETVVFVKRDDRWLMERYHATRIEPGN